MTRLREAYICRKLPLYGRDRWGSAGCTEINGSVAYGRSIRSCGRLTTVRRRRIYKPLSLRCPKLPVGRSGTDSQPDCHCRGTAVEPSIFLDFRLPNAATWFYFALFLTVALFFQFTRIVSIRNLDLLMLFLLVPGFLILQESAALSEAAGRTSGDEAVALASRAARERGSATGGCSSARCSGSCVPCSTSCSSAGPR